MALPNPVIVLPGITAVYLRDMYPLPPEIIFKVLESSRDYTRAAFHPDSRRLRRWLEAREPARIVPDQVFEIAYKELIEELRHNLQDSEQRPVPVYSFNYDWRQPLDLIEADLDLFIEEVIQRTSLMKHYFDDGYDTPPRRKVNLIGHSMGGLIIAGYLQGRFDAQPRRVEKVVTLAAPFQGSIEAIVLMVTGNANLGVSSPSSREREAARALPSLYHLLPSFRNGIEIPQPLPQSLFDATVWQKSIIDTLSEYVRKYGLQPANAVPDGQAMFQQLLSLGQQHRNRIQSLDLATCGLSLQDWLCVVGVDSKTRVHIAIDPEGQTGPEFRFDPAIDLKNDWPASIATGDGTVPLEGAMPSFLPRENIVCIKPDDFDFWEIQDRALVAVAGLHGLMPNMDMLHRMIVRFFKPEARGDAWARPLVGVPPDEWQRPAFIKFKA